MDVWATPNPLVTQGLIDRIAGSAALPDDTTKDTPAQRDMRNLLAFVSYVQLAAKQGQVAANPDQAILGLFDPAMMDFELP